MKSFLLSGSTIQKNLVRARQQAVAASHYQRARTNQPLVNFNFRFFAATIQKVPTMGDSISEGVVQTFEKQIGDYVKADEVIAKIETDKVTVDILAAQSGVITKFFAEEGDTITVGADLCTFDTDAKAPAAGAPKETPKDAPQQTQAPAQTQAPKVEQKVEPKKEAPSTPTKAAPQMKQAPTSSSNAKKGPTSIEGSRTEVRVKMNKMRQTIAKRLKESQNTNALLTTFNEIDMGNFMEARTQVQEQFTKKHGVKLGFMSAFMKASVQALKEQPVVNAVIDDNEMVYRDFIDISTAVSTPTGLVVPVIRNCQELNFHHMEQALNDLAKRAREGGITLEDMAGGTFTITNGGVFGSMMGTPIVNMPQSAILGMHATKLRPTVVGQSIVARPIMYVALTYDHRIIDGREAVLFLRKIKECIEDPKMILFDL